MEVGKTKYWRNVMLREWNIGDVEYLEAWNTGQINIVIEILVNLHSVSYFFLILHLIIRAGKNPVEVHNS